MNDFNENNNYGIPEGESQNGMNNEPETTVPEPCSAENIAENNCNGLASDENVQLRDDVMVCAVEPVFGQELDATPVDEPVFTEEFEESSNVQFEDVADNRQIPVNANMGYNFYSENIYQQKKTKKSTIWISVVAGFVAGIVLTVVAGTTVKKYVDLDFGKTKVESGKTEKGDGENSFDFSQLTDDEREPKSVVDIAAEVGPSVVMVTTTSTVNTFFGSTLQQGSGSGIIISKEGYIITNNHVIEDSQIVKVVLSDGTESPAEVIGADAKTDIAVLKIEAGDNLTVAVVGDSDKLQVGELAIAIGNPLGTQLTGTVTQGVISAVNRTVEASTNTYVNLIQTDAAINQGNSGGALVNGYGEVIGINTVKYAASGVEGIGFAIPINDVLPIVEDLIDKGYVSGRPVIGINVIEVDEQLAYVNNLPIGLYVSAITPGSAAEFGGVREGDVIVKADGKKIESVDELNAIRDTKKVGDKMTLGIYRNGKNIEIDIKLLEDRSSAER